MDKLKKIQNGAFWRLIGMEIIHCSNGKAALKVAASPNIMQIYDKVHGGVIAALVDSSIVLAAESILLPNEGTNTVELNLNYLRPAEKGEDLIADAEIIQKGKNIIVGTSQVRNEKGKIIAVGRATLIIKQTHLFR